MQRSSARFVASPDPRRCTCGADASLGAAASDGSDNGRPQLRDQESGQRPDQQLDDELTALLDHAKPGELDVVVVANGCTDDTADRARSVPGAQVVP